jgi:glycosyltransferase involved in cell wall biosynthesis
MRRGYRLTVRVVQVSGHYPPDFVSGGTLVPQRIARGLAARGHEVHAFAGNLTSGREPLAAWDDEDGHGVHVRWIASHPWTAWGETLTYDNPAVTEAFTAWAAELRPDVVHAHSLQSLGVGLVEAAADLGARVVVTAHDFWWHCARQFLVDRSMIPCSLVVAAGDCACERDRRWLATRTARLSAALARADLVLAPSASAARVLVANGIDPDRVRLDENGVPAASGTLPATTTEPAPAGGAGNPGPVRVLFTGGPDPMKGWPVLAEASRRLDGVDGWQLTAVGLDAAGVRGLPAAVGAAPRYRPEDLATVLAAHDVLVLPSLMRESHSLVTREALTAGLTVVCTDTLGPEEAVTHGRNGLVVPAGDAAALAAAIRALADDRDLLARLRDSDPPVVRSVSEQVLGLEGLYATLLAAPEPAAGRPLPHDPPVPGPVPAPVARARPVGEPARRPGPTADQPVIRRVLFVAGIEGAPLRYRACDASASRSRSAGTATRRCPRCPSAQTPSWRTGPRRRGSCSTSWMRRVAAGSRSCSTSTT